jgi:hypothetical protein
MIDVFNIPSQQQPFTFYATGNWQTWNKPRNAKMIEIFCLGGGGGGSHTTATPSNIAGGGGGASGGIVRGLIPAFLLPDTLYILVGKGGVGPSTSNTAGGSGGISYVSLQPSTSEQTLICKSSTTVAGGSSSAGTGGVAAAISVVALSAFGNLGLFTAIAGVPGSTGGVNTGGNGNNQTALGTNLVTGGASGGGKNATTSVFGSGGTIIASSAILTTQVSGGVTAGQNGDSGYGTLQPFCGTGGSGGAGITTGQGGQGGNGFYGCGGGGVGGGSVASKAGNGGDGLVIITVIS